MPSGKPKLVSFESLAGVSCYYARINAAYGDISKCTKTRRRRLHPVFLQQLGACILELRWLTQPILGELTAIVSGGAWVPLSKKRPKPDWHTRGRAYDLGGLHWKGALGSSSLDRPRKLVWNDVADYYHDDRDSGEPAPALYRLYLGAESVLRRSFGTCLGIRYNSRHHNHEHIDPGTKVGYWDKGFGSTTRTSYMRDVLPVAWNIETGSTLKSLREAIREVRAQLSLASLSQQQAWQQFLLVTAMVLFQSLV